MNRYRTLSEEKKNPTEYKKKQRRKKKTQNFKLVFITCIWVLFSASIVFSMNNNSLENKTETTVAFMVTEGDSLWSIGKQYCPEDMDIRKYIHQIMELNNMKDTTLYVNQHIMIPIKEYQ